MSAKALKTGMRGVLRKHWLVMDMDGTVVPTPTKGGGHYLSLAKSACKPQLQRWIGLGGSVCLISTAGKRMWTQAYKELQEAIYPKREGDVVGKLVLCGFSGAALFQSDRQTKEMHEHTHYRETAVAGKSTCIPSEHLSAIATQCREVMMNFFRAAAQDPELIAMLSKKYHTVYTEMVEQMKEMGEEKFFNEVFTLKNLNTHGRFLSATQDALLDPQTVPGTEPAVVVQFTVMGIPMKKFDDFFTPQIVEEMSKLGVYVKRQPNSVVVAPHGVNKATSIQWLIDNAKDYDDFKLERAIAFGDFPATVDRPMTEFKPMEFVSVSKDPELDPPGLIHVGWEEDGTAMFLDELISAFERGARGLDDDSMFDKKMLQAAGIAAKERLNALPPGATQDAKVLEGGEKKPSSQL